MMCFTFLSDCLIAWQPKGAELGSRAVTVRLHLIERGDLLRQSSSKKSRIKVSYLTTSHIWKSANVGIAPFNDM
jgi:hypothetical protein